MPILTPKMVEFWKFLWCPRTQVLGHVGPKNQKIWKFFSEILFKKVQGKKIQKKNLTKNLVLILFLKPFDNGIDLRSNLKRTAFIQRLEWNDLTNLTQTSLPYWSEAQEALYRTQLSLSIERLLNEGTFSHHHTEVTLTCLVCRCRHITQRLPYV